jgi:hypothetical protein
VTIYEMLVKGHLDGRWSQRFDGLQITNLENGRGHALGCDRRPGRAARSAVPTSEHPTARTSAAE